MVDAGGKATNFVAVTEDITLRKQIEDDLKRSLRDKEILLKEIHHRVKNNLQIVSSLLNLQAVNCGDPAVRKAFADSQQRIQTIVLVHEQLYKSESLEVIEFGNHLARIARNVWGTYGRKEIVLDIDVARVVLSIDLAIPCGLIANELLTNAMKHAFPGPGPGRIIIKLCYTDPDHAEMVIGDDGVGMEADHRIDEMPTLGMRLVSTLLKQLSARMEVDTSHGMTFRLNIPVRPDLVSASH
jgi:two-component sensor histidine kinase